MENFLAQAAYSGFSWLSLHMEVVVLSRIP